MRKLLALILLLTVGAVGAHAQTKINALSAAGASAGADFFPVSQSGGNATKQTVTALFATPPGIGGTTPAAGAFTTLSASSTVSGTGFSTYLASPPAIGGTTAAAGSFTTLTASSTVSGAGITSLFASPPAIGGTAPAAGAFTTLSATSTVSGAGITALFASPPTIGGTAAAGASFSSLTLTGITGSTQCLTVNSSGVVSGTGSACGAGGGGGSGTVNSGTAGQLTYYASTGTAVSGNANATISNGDVTLGASAVQGSVKFNGSTSGTLQIKPAAVAGSGSVLTLPGGTTDFSSTGGSNQVVQQTSAGGALTVAQLGFSNLSGSYTFAQGPTIATNTILGNSSGSTAAPSAQTIGAGLVMNASGLQTTITDSLKTANYTVAAGDMGGLLNLSGTFTLTIPAISSTILTTGMSVSYQNQGTGNVTISSTPTINGLNSTTVPPGGFGTFVGNGSTLDFTGLSTPTTTAIGGILAITCTSGQFISAITTSGGETCATPAGGGNVSTSGTITTNGVAYWASSTGAASTAAMTNGQLLVGVTSGAPAPQTMSGDCTLNASGVIACFATPATVAKGGTGLGTLTAHAVLLGEGTSNVAFAGPSSTSGAILASAGSSADPAFDTNATISAGALSLGASGTAGSVAMGNATSGVLTLQPVTGALGTVTASLPANTGTIAELNLAQTWSAAQTFNSNDLVLAGVASGTQCLHANSSGVVTGTGSDCGSGGGGSTTIVSPQGRLTLVSATPVLTANETAKSQIYYDCYRGNNVPYYTGSADALDTIASCEVSLTMQTSGTGVTNSGGVFDIWWVHGGANRVCVATNGSGGGWASDTGGSNTARGTGYSQVHNTRGYWTNVNSIASCYNGTTNYGSVSADQATYLGTIYTTAAGQTGMNFNPAAASGGTNIILGLWNAYNRVPVVGISLDSESNWSFATANGVWRSMASSASNRASWVDGLAQSNAECDVSVMQKQVTTAASVWYASGCDLDATTSAPFIQATGMVQVASSANFMAAFQTSIDLFLPQTGLHFGQAVEAITAGGGGSNNASAQAAQVSLKLGM